MTPSIPFVSIIVPVRNGGERLRRCIEALLAQDYPKDRYEIIIIDNGSTDGSQDIIRSYPVTFLEETSAASPYVARNLGLEHANGDIYAFTDGGCIASELWLTEGVKALRDDNADLAGGRVDFDLNKNSTAAEVYDSMTNIQMERCVKNRGIGKGCNLFISRQVFEKFGPWPVQRSGGDVKFTGRATKAGCRMVYAADARVLYPTRRLKALLKKTYRVGREHPYMWDMSRWQLLKRIAKNTLVLFLPPSKVKIRARMHRHGVEVTPERVRELRRVAWAVGTVAKTAYIVNMSKILIFGKRKSANASNNQ